jgi:peptidoglycan/xylan/chitin deacetylase (PgdA/CDA1 family)
MFSPRWDRLVTLYLFGPLANTGWLSSQLHIPILMYHSISDDPEPGVSAYYKTNTSPARFASHMRDLAERGYKTLQLDEALAMLAEGPEKTYRLRGNYVVVTFDDGFRDVYTHAFPVLQKHGFRATVFLPTAFIKETRGSFKGKQCLTWNEVRELHRCGIDFGSHTVNHPKLVDLPWQVVQREVHDSKDQLEQQLGSPVTTFAYPYAFPQADREFAARFKVLLEEARYQCCVTTEIGRAQRGGSPYRMKRLPVNSDDDNALFQAKLTGSYDWLALPQAVLKKCKAAFREPKDNARFAPNPAHR